MKTTAPNPTLSPEDLAVLFQTARKVWQDIGFDCLQALADDKGANINHISIPRDEVIELVLDATRLEDECLRLPNAAQRARLRQWLRDAPSKRVDATLRNAFPSPRYGT